MNFQVTLQISQPKKRENDEWSHNYYYCLVKSIRVRSDKELTVLLAYQFVTLEL